MDAVGIDVSEITELPDVASATVLIVDDEHNILVALKRVLKDEGCQVITAQSGESALDNLAAREVDVVISDMYMPGMNGADLLGAIADKWPAVIRILLTGYSDMNMTIEAVNRGRIYQYVAKPWDNEELRILVRRAIQYKQAEDQRRRLLELTRQQNDELVRLNETLEEKVATRTEELKQALVMKDCANSALRSSYTEAIKVFSNLLEARTGVVAGHSRRVAEHSISIARRMQLGDSHVRDIMYAALLHDIGKIGFSDDLLTTPVSSMSETMRRKVAAHPELGRDMLAAMGGLERAAELIRSHHELYDGSGYPEGLKQEDIPLGARIITIANEYDNLLCGTYNGRKLSSSAALDMLSANKGKRYDPTVVDIFMEVLHAPSRQTVAGDVRKLQLGALKSGMILLEDIVTEAGNIIMRKGTVLDQQRIYRIQSLETVLDTSFEIRVRG